jgi:2-oxoglutarate/2-oxoacid ferredoxin oxidoreductase subunit beta
MKHPYSNYLREDRMPHMWCPGCGIGTAMNAFIGALQKTGLDKNDVAVVSGIGCSGRVAGYLNLDSFHTTHGRAIPFAAGLKSSSPNTKVVVFSGDGDLISIGGNHLIHAGRKNIDITVICVNNLNYAMTGGQVSATTPKTSITATAPFGSFCSPFNLPFLAEASGAVYVSRWTVYHVIQLEKAILNALNKKGFSFVEAISPCPTLFERRNKMGTGLTRMKFYKENSVIKNDADVRNIDINLNEKIIVGDFINKNDKPTYLEAMNAFYDKAFECKVGYRTFKGAKYANLPEGC